MHLICGTAKQQSVSRTEALVKTDGQEVLKRRKEKRAEQRRARRD